MGRGIAQVAAATGLDVALSDASLALAEQGKDKIAKALVRQVDKGKMSGEDRDALLARITPVAGPAGFDAVELAIEAATETFDLKVGIFKSLDEAVPKTAPLASNTSS
ncbi:MAG: 3-hydroxyacyl-CoA dehydrogenase NAD-binding domain-containing protein, partial [Myxococcota bacterium]